MLKFFAKRLKLNQPIALYGLTTFLVEIQPFTNDSSHLIAVANTLLHRKDSRGAPPPPEVIANPSLSPFEAGRAGGTDAVLEDMLSRQERQEFNMSQHDRAERTLIAFRQLGQALAGVPGKKTIVWMTGDASPLNPSMLYQFVLNDPKLEAVGPQASWFLAHVYEALNGAGASVFPLDVRGVSNAGLSGADHASTHSEFTQLRRGSQPTDMNAYSGVTSLKQGEAANAILAMEGVAAETGGMVLRGSNEIGELLDRAENLWSTYYVLSFDPTKVVDADKRAYHTIKVTVPGKSGARVLARRGFLTEPQNAAESEEQLQSDLREGATSPVDLTSLGLTLTLGPESQNSREVHVPFSLTIHGSSTFSDRVELALAVLVRDERGNVLRSHGDNLVAQVAAGQAESVARLGLSYHGAFDAPSGQRTFGRVIVLDKTTRELGTITIGLGEGR